MEHPRSGPLLRQIRHIEHEDTACIVGRDIVEHVGVHRVLNLNASHVVFGPRIFNDHILRLSNVDARVRGTNRDNRVDERIFSLNWVDSVSAVIYARSARPLRPHSPDHDIARFIDLQRVALRILDGQIFDHEVTPRDKQSLSADQLSLKIENRIVHALTTDRNAIRCER